MSLKLEIKGTNAFIKAMTGLSDIMEKKIVPRAASNAMMIIVRAARKKLPHAGDSSHYIGYDVQENSGKLRESIGIKRYKNRRKITYVVAAGPRRGYTWTDSNGKKQDPMRYGIPVEFGHVLKVFGKPTNIFIPPMSYMRNSVVEKEDEVIAKFRSNITKAIKRFAATGK